MTKSMIAAAASAPTGIDEIPDHLAFARTAEQARSLTSCRPYLDRDLDRVARLLRQVDVRLRLVALA